MLRSYLDQEGPTRSDKLRLDSYFWDTLERMCSMEPTVNMHNSIEQGPIHIGAGLPIQHWSELCPCNSYHSFNVLFV